MTFDEFKARNKREQMETVWGNGVLIGDRVEGIHKILLYQVDAFYVEVYYYHTDYNVIQKIKCFISTKHLQPYLDWMTITI